MPGSSSRSWAAWNTAGADGVVHLVVNALDRVIAVTVTAEVAKSGEAVVRIGAGRAYQGFCQGQHGRNRRRRARGADPLRSRALPLAVMPIEQLPPVPVIDDAAGEIELDRKELLEAIKQVAFAASTEEIRYYMNGILFHDRDDRLVLVATDGHRLAKCQIPSAPFSADHSCIVPMRRSRRSSSCSPRPRSKTCGCGGRKACSRSARRASPRLEADRRAYPDYARVVPETPANSATVDHADLVAALTRLDAVAKHSKRFAALVGLAWDPAEPVLRLSLPHQPDAADDVIAATVAGDAPGQTAAQIRHVVELVDELRGERVCIATAGAGNPILITDPEDDAG